MCGFGNNEGTGISREQVFTALRSGLRRARNPIFIYVSLALAGMALIVAAVAPLASTIVERWSQRDVELRSRLIFNSIRDQVSGHLGTTSGTALVTLFERI